MSHLNYNHLKCFFELLLFKFNVLLVIFWFVAAKWRQGFGSAAFLLLAQYQSTIIPASGKCAYLLPLEGGCDSDDRFPSVFAQPSVTGHIS